MNGKELILKALNFEKTPTNPTMLHSFMPAAREASLTMADYRSSGENIAKAHLNFARKYGLSGILMDIDTCLLADAIGLEIDYPENEPARIKHQDQKSIEQLLEMMDPDKLKKSDRIIASLEAVSIMKNEAKGEILIRGNCDQMAFSLAMLAYGMQDFMMDLLDEDMEEDILKLIDRAYYVHLEYHKLMNEAGADITSFGDSSCGPDLISKDCYMKFSYPYHLKLKNDLDKLGIKTICHICGNLDNIIEEVSNIKFAGVEIDYKTNIVNAQKVMKNKSVVFGNLDPSGLFYFGTEEEIAKETIKLLDVFKGEGLVIGAGCALPKTTPEKNIRAFVDACQNHTF